MQINKHSNELPIPNESIKDPNAMEILRAWVSRGSQIVSMRSDVFENPFMWGMFFQDLAKHVANANGQNDFDKESIMEQIREGFMAEMRNPTGVAGGHFEEESGAPEDFLFDDCSICQAQKNAIMEGRNLSEKELRKAFKEAKEKGNEVGGEWFEEDEE